MVPDPTMAEEPPHGVTLEVHAQISAEIAEGDRGTSAVLAAHDLTEAHWNDASVYWMMRIGQDVRERGDSAQLAHAYSEAFGRAQDGIRPPPSMDAASYAGLVVAVQKAGGPAQPLAARGFSTADYLRLSRHWARVLSSDPAQAKIFFEAYERLQ